MDFNELWLIDWSIDAQKLYNWLIWWKEEEEEAVEVLFISKPNNNLNIQYLKRNRCATEIIWFND